ncbi:MAG: hypothetical protein UV73_C0007G0022 [Candidatus Gottesmanbacteria bacterium GW2011_GWA2_43_14]|uniref:Uncharacterized protein n=1 Tax=Candidatus Gottesmanbacteria bacterium GW2011_GWA2_43_14 TaxID=1618443 RepID=A0A0G1DIQ8_9BACT|nr:MAG: hypothetical protein UV73_C0007G0022 [Candidatus Gottesmanbacteria bacterium GW2011_GWA2_43_14]
MVLKETAIFSVENQWHFDFPGRPPAGIDISLTGAPADIEILYIDIFVPILYEPKAYLPPAGSTSAAG